MKKFRRVCVVVLDGFGVGSLPDASDFQDEGANTFLHVWKHCKTLKLPQFRALGLFDTAQVEDSLSSENTIYSKMKETSAGKDTTTGHWEMMGLPVAQSFDVFANGFPADLLDDFLKQTGLSSYLGNKAASGTTIIEELGQQHLETGYPIVYTSADSVFQIAWHEELFGLERLYEICETTRKLINESNYRVGRVIARPFVGRKPGEFRRTPNRKDYSLKPHGDTALSRLHQSNYSVIGIGKIPSIFDYVGISEEWKAKSDDEGIEATVQALRQETQEGLIFSNLNDLDMLYGHRRNPTGYGKQLERIDQGLQQICQSLREDDLLVVTSDHGNDPTFKGSDHTREYVPLLMTSGGFQKRLGLKPRDSFADLGESILENFGLPLLGTGKSFLREMR